LPRHDLQNPASAQEPIPDEPPESGQRPVERDDVVAAADGYDLCVVERDHPPRAADGGGRSGDRVGGLGVPEAAQNSTSRRLPRSSQVPTELAAHDTTSEPTQTGTSFPRIESGRAASHVPPSVSFSK
jgi:hypothetical protein